MEVGATALLAWTVVCLGFVTLHLDAVDDSWRLVLYLASIASALLLLLCISAAERRVAYITEAFVIGMIGANWPDRD